MNNAAKEGDLRVDRKNESETAMPEIDSQLAQLKYFENDLQNDEVIKARTALLKVFDPRFKWFKSHNIIITYHGSLQYNDPHNLDADVEFMRSNLEFKDVGNKYFEIEDELKKPNAWPRKNCDTNFGVCSINGIKNDLKKLEKENYASDFQELHALDPDLNAALILSSKVLYGVQKPQLELLRKKVRKIIVRNQWLRNGVYDTLANVITIRQDRRK